MVFSSKFCAVLLLLTMSTTASADLMYKPDNPSFGGDSFNSSHLQSLATTQNEYKPKTGTASQSTSARFIAMLQSRLYSSLATQVADAIFGENAQPSGTMTFDDQSINFVNGDGHIVLTITNLITGEETIIDIPNLSN